ncbi:MAG: preprotein translocase subunit SecY [Planctomycetes bacterium]|nr:preprotein translocase subunit SecY [Planctomycetota bacterium]
MFETLAKIFNVKELRGKIMFTALLLIIYRLGCFIPAPGIDVSALTEFMQKMMSGNNVMGKVLSMADMFSGGAIRSGAIFSLGIMPYITASIIFQLLVAIVPSLSRIAHGGATGRKKIQQLTRLSTVFLCIVQAGMISQQFLAHGRTSGLVSSNVGNLEFVFYGIMSLTVGTMFLMWLGEQIDEFGIGNGVSLIIMAGIIARMPSSIGSLFTDAGQPGGIGIGKIALIIVLFVMMTLAVVLITLGTRRVAVQASKANRGRKVYGGQRQVLPLRVNQAGVIPIIFAQAILSLPAIVFGWLGENFAMFRSAGQLFSPGMFWYTVFYVLLIMFFCYFYTAITFNPNEMADNLKQSGMYIPGIRPGKRTAEHLEKIMTRIALAGSIFLSFVAILPQFVSRWLEIDWGIAGMLGGTGLLIVVGVALDVVQRVESYLLMKNYDGFGVAGGKVRGRRR